MEDRIVIGENPLCAVTKIVGQENKSVYCEGRIMSCEADWLSSGLSAALSDREHWGTGKPMRGMVRYTLQKPLV
jgi:hypothetical protein